MLIVGQVNSKLFETVDFRVIKQKSRSKKSGSSENCLNLSYHSITRNRTACNMGYHVKSKPVGSCVRKINCVIRQT